MKQGLVWYIGWPSLTAVVPDLGAFFIRDLGLAYLWQVLCGFWELSSSSTNCSSFSLGLSIVAWESASAVNWCFPGTYLTVNLINQRQTYWIWVWSWIARQCWIKFEGTCGQFLRQHSCPQHIHLTTHMPILYLEEDCTNAVEGGISCNDSWSTGVITC